MCTAAFSGRQLAVLADEVLTEVGVFTDYTDTDGKWITEKDSGDPVTQTVWTRCTPAMLTINLLLAWSSCFEEGNLMWCRCWE